MDGAVGERPRAVEEYDAFDELTTALSVRTFVGARFAPGGRLFQRDESAASSSRLPGLVDLEGDALGYAIAADVDPGADATTLHLAIRYAEPGAVDDRSSILDAIAPTGTDRDVETDGAMVGLRATYPTGAI